MNKKCQDFVFSYLLNTFKRKTPFKGIEGHNFILIHLRLGMTKHGIVHTHCIVLLKRNGYVYKSRTIPPMPTFLIHLISFWKIEKYHEQINAIQFYVEFKQPLTDEVIAELPCMMDEPVNYHLSPIKP